VTTPCPACGMEHEDPQASRRCETCPCIAKLRDVIAHMEFKVGKHYSIYGSKGGKKKRGPGCNTKCVCENCKADYLAAGNRSRWCRECRKFCYRRWHLNLAIKARAEKKATEERRSRGAAA
jgi:hypothetical protein